MTVRRSKQEGGIARGLTTPLSLLLVVLSCGCPKVASLAAQTSVKKKTVVQVCQHKDCCRRFRDAGVSLVQTMENLLPPDAPISIEASGCLSKCELGPNVSVDDETNFFSDVKDAQAAAAVLELACPGLSVPPTLFAAESVMRKARRASSLDEKEKLLNSVIKALDGRDDGLADSAANAHAHAMRAEVRLDLSRPSEAREDALRATELSPAHPTAWRTLAEAHEAMGDDMDAISALNKWANVNPQFQSKVIKEKSRLSNKIKKYLDAGNDVEEENTGR